MQHKGEDMRYEIWFEKHWIQYVRDNMWKMCDEMEDVGIFVIRQGIELCAVETGIEDMGYRRGNRGV